MKVVSSKTNRWGHKTETVYGHCNCDENIRVIPCPVHFIKCWISVRNIYHHEQFGAKDFPFIHMNGKPLKCYQLNTWMHNVVIELNKVLNLNMDHNHRTPHTLRTGGCSDWARQGQPSWRIEMQGRWSSKMWRNTYINMNWKDMANLRGCTVSQLLKEIKSQPYE